MISGINDKSPRGRRREEKPGGTEYINGSVPKLILQVFEATVQESADWHPFRLDKEPWFDSLVVYNQNEDSFYHHVMLHNNSLSDDEVLYLRKNVQCYQ